MSKLILFLTMLGTLISSMFGAYGGAKENVRFIAHRGFSALYLENTAEAFEKAAKHGSDGAETDIRVTKDGVLVCSHNSGIVLCDGSEMEIADHTYAELTEKPLRNLRSLTKVYLCKFEDYLRIMAKHNMICFIEFKGSFDEATVREAFEMAREIYDLSRCSLQSFNMDNLDLAHRLFPELPIMLTVGTEELDLLDAALERGYDIDIDFNCLTQEIVDKFHAAGLEVGAWTCNTRAAISYCLSMNVDYIESDLYAR